MRIFFLSDGLFLAGGQHVNLDHARTLRRMGYDARLWVIRVDAPAADFVPTFPAGEAVPWQNQRPDFAPQDVVVMGEMHGAGAMALQDARVRRIVHNQGPYLSFEAFIDIAAFRAWGCEAMICPSDHAAGMLRRIGWDGPLHVVRPALDPVFAPEPHVARHLRIAAVTTKRYRELRFIRGLIRSWRPDLNHVPWIGISGVPKAEAARRMKTCEIFLALGQREGLGLPPLEAMWGGALAAGFHGGGGREYATAENGDWFGDDQHFEVAEALISLVDRLKAGERFEARRAAGLAAAERFSRANFEAQLAAVWSVLAPAP